MNFTKNFTQDIDINASEKIQNFPRNTLQRLFLSLPVRLIFLQVIKMTKLGLYNNKKKVRMKKVVFFSK